MRSGWKMVVVLAAMYAVLTGFYPPDRGPVTDGADLFSARAEGELASELRRFREETGVVLQVVTVTVANLEGEAMGTYALNLFQAQESGYPRDVARVLFVATSMQEGGRLQIARSSNVRDTLTPSMVDQIGREVIRERHGSHDMATALTNGLRAVERTFATPPPQARSSYDWLILGIAAVAVIVLIVIFFAWLASRRRGRRQSRRDTAELGEAMVDLGQAGLSATLDRAPDIMEASSGIDVSGFTGALGDAASGAASTIGDLAKGAADGIGDAIGSIDVSDFGSDD